MWRATVVMVISWVVGQAVGFVAQRTIERQVDSYKQVNPFPSLSKMDVNEDDDDIIVVDSEPQTENPQAKTEAEAA